VAWRGRWQGPFAESSNRRPFRRLLSFFSPPRQTGRGSVPTSSAGPSRLPPRSATAAGQDLKSRARRAVHGVNRGVMIFIVHATPALCMPCHVPEHRLRARSRRARAVLPRHVPERRLRARSPRARTRCMGHDPCRALGTRQATQGLHEPPRSCGIHARRRIGRSAVATLLLRVAGSVVVPDGPALQRCQHCPGDRATKRWQAVPVGPGAPGPHGPRFRPSSGKEDRQRPRRCQCAKKKGAPGGRAFIAV
jgi:hypothetical protein